MFFETKQRTLLYFSADAEMMNEDDDSAGFRIAVVLAEEEEPNDIDWSTLIISNEITYSKHIFIAEH